MRQFAPGQVWRSPKLNQFDRTIGQVDGEWLYFYSQGSERGWVTTADFAKWVSRYCAAMN